MSWLYWIKELLKKKAIHQSVWFFTKDIDTPLGLYVAHKHLTITFFLYIGEFPIMTNMNDLCLPDITPAQWVLDYEEVPGIPVLYIW